MSAPIQFPFSKSDDDANASGTIAPAGTVDVLIDVSGGRYFSLLIKNTGGANAIDSGAITISPRGTLFAPLPGYTFASIGAGVIVYETYGPFAASKLKVHLGSTGGTTYTLEWYVGV